MSFVHNSTEDEKAPQENKEKAGLEKRIKVLENVNKTLADHNRKLKDQVRVYEQRNVVPSGVGEADYTTRDFERFSIQETAENFVENFYEKEKEPLKVKCEMLEKANQNLTEENGKLKEQLDYHKQLNTRSKEVANFNIKLQEENEMLKNVVKYYEAVEKDDKDGASMVEEKKFSDQVGLPDLAGFRNPFNCAGSCVPSVVYFIFHKMNLRVCNKRLIMEMHCTLSELSEEACAVGNCSLSFEDFYNVGLIKKTPALHKKVIDANKTESWLQEAIETMEGESHPALFMMHYKENEDGKKRAGHCMAIMPDGTFIDVQMKQIWEPKHDKRLKSVNLIEVWKIERKAAKDWEEKCGLIKCAIECMVCASDRSECSSELN